MLGTRGFIFRKTVVYTVKQVGNLANYWAVKCECWPVFYISIHTNARILFKSTTTIQDLTKHREHKKKCGIYRLTCNNCKISYVGQTSHGFKKRLKEHSRYIKQNDPKSVYALRILNNNHEYGPIKTNMFLLKQITKTSLLIPMNNFMFNHTLTTRNSYRNKTQVKRTQCTSWSSTPALRHHPQYTPINTPTLFRLPRPQYWTQSSTQRTAYTVCRNNILITLYIIFWDSALLFLKNS
jgi:hypothetical protein